MVGSDFEVATECDKPLSEYLFQSGVGTDDDLLNRLGRWIEIRGPKVDSDQAPGHVETISKVWGMMHRKDVLLRIWPN